MGRIYFFVGAFAVVSILSGCGTRVPEMQNFWESRDAGLIQVNELKEHVSCEVISAVQNALSSNDEINMIRKRSGLPITDLSDIKKWRAEILLTLTVDEKGQTNPSVSLTPVFPNVITAFPSGPVTVGQTGSLGLAGQFSTDATRKITVAYAINLEDYLTGRRAKKLAAAAEKGIRCFRPGSAFTDGDLKFKDTLDSVLAVAIKKPEGSQEIASTDFMKELKDAEKAIKKDVISHEVTFTVVYGLSITPSIKLVNVSANQGTAPFLGATRTNTQDVTITLGPVVDGQPNATAAATILATQINIGTANAIQQLRN